MSPQPQHDLESIQAILEARARELARPAAEVEDDAEFTEMAIAESGDELFALDLCHLREVRTTPSITKLPWLPAAWAGLMNLRGALYPVLDLARYLGASPAVDVDGFDVVVVEGKDFGIGLLVDRVVEVRRVRNSDVDAPIGVGTGVISGVTSDLVSVIDIDALLDDPALVVEDGTL